MTNELKPTGEEILAAAKALANRNADICNVNRDDNWAIYSEEFLESAAVSLDAAYAVRAPAPQPDPIWSTDAARDVLAERARQVGAEGFMPTHDDQHDDGVLVCAAIAYAGADTVNYPINEPPDMWPWTREWWKPADDRRNLVKAAALLIAEIERLDRAGGDDADAHA